MHFFVRHILASSFPFVFERRSNRIVSWSRIFMARRDLTPMAYRESALRLLRDEIDVFRSRNIFINICT